MKDLIGAAHNSSLVTFGQVGSESKPPFGILDDTTNLPPFFQRFLRRVFRLHIKVLIQITLHPLFLLSFFVKTFQNAFVPKTASSASFKYIKIKKYLETTNKKKKDTSQPSKNKESRTRKETQVLLSPATRLLQRQFPGK